METQVKKRGRKASTKATTDINETIISSSENTETIKILTEITNTTVTKDINELNKTETEINEPNKIKEPKQPKQPKQPKEPKKPKEPKEPKKLKEPKTPKEPKMPKEPKTPKEPKIPKVKKEYKISKKLKNNVEFSNNNINEEEDIVMKTKRRGRKPKDKFKYENSDYDEFQKNTKKEDNIIIKLPLSCLKLNEEFNIGKDLFPYNPNLSIPKPQPEYLLNKTNIKYSMLNDLTDNELTDNDLTDNELIDKDLYNNLENNYEIENNDSTNSGELNMENNNINFETDFEKNINKSKNNSNNSNNNNGIISNNLKCNKYNNIKSNNIADQNKQLQNNINTQNQNHTQFCNKCYHCQQIKSNDEDVRQIDIILNNKYNSNTDKINVLTHLGLNLNGGKWINNTHVSCLWCCHSFKNIPWGIPYKFVNDKFILFGNFCMANCALSYILQYYKDDDSLWEKVALLNLLYFKVFGLYKNLLPAFDKMSLKMFGGTMEIEEFRNVMFSNEKSYSIEFPPCNTIIPMLEEIYKKSALSNTFIPVDKNKINLAINNELKLKRSKPITNHKNTLDFCLGKTK